MSDKNTPNVEMSGQLYAELRNWVKPVYLLWMDGGEPTSMWTPDIDRMNALLFDFANAELDDQEFINRLFRDPDSRETKAFVARLRQQQQEVKETGTSTYRAPADLYATSRVPGGGAPTPYADLPMGGSIMRENLRPQELVDQVLRFIDPEFRPWFILETTNLKDVIEKYPGTPNIPAEDRKMLVEARQIVDQLAEQGADRPTGGERNRLLADAFANLQPFVESGQQFTETYDTKIANLERVLATTRFVDPIADPLGRDTEAAGFGRAPEPGGEPVIADRPTAEAAGVQTRPPSVGQMGSVVPPTEMGTLGLPLTPEQRYGTGEGTRGPDRMGGPPTITPRSPRTEEEQRALEAKYGTGAGTRGPDRMGGPATLTGEDGAGGGTGEDGAGGGTGGDTGGDTGGGAGGGTGGDGAGGGVGVETPYDDSVPEDWKQAASEIYGAYYSIISQNPDVANLIAQAEAEKWGPEKFDYELEQTTWWKTHSVATRTFDIEMQRDPATVQARIDALAAQIREDALSLNIRLTGETLNNIATEAIRQGWTEQQVTIALGDEAVKSQAGVTGLRYGYYGNKINEIAGSYGVSVSDLEFSQLVEKFALGRENEESLTSAFQTRATALFPAISERLMAGETFANIVEPYRNRASQILGQDFSASDFMDNDSFAQAVTYMGDDGKQRPMTYTEWGQYLRSNREFGYEYTEEAQGRAYQVANRIADIFGAI